MQRDSLAGFGIQVSQVLPDPTPSHSRKKSPQSLVAPTQQTWQSAPCAKV